MPRYADQPYSAERCAALGVARTVGGGDRAPGTIRAAVRQVLTEPSYGARARAFQAEMRELPGPGHMVELLEAPLED